MSFRMKSLALLPLAAASLLAASLFAEDTFEGVQRIVAIGDIHGDYDRLVELLRSAQVVDRNNAWTGGATHLVLTGDFLDRGPAPRQVMDLLMELEPQAEMAGGRVHALIGNHEAMNIYGDLRFVSREDVESYRTPNSGPLRERVIKAVLEDLRAKGSPPKDEAKFRKKFEDEHPLGLAERELAFAPDGKYGKWLRGQNAIIKINDLVFVHGGIGPKYAAWTREEINQTIRAELDDLTKWHGGMAEDPDGPLWYRDLALSPESNVSLEGEIDRVLHTQQARHMVIGHTVIPAILPRFAGRVITIDVGLSALYGGPPAFLLVEGSKYYAVYRGQRVDLPVGRGSLPQYLRAAEAADPSNQKLRNLVRAGGRPALQLQQ
jgi:hypothetical protein